MNGSHSTYGKEGAYLPSNTCTAQLNNFLNICLHFGRQLQEPAPTVCSAPFPTGKLLNIINRLGQC